MTRNYTSDHHNHLTRQFTLNILGEALRAGATTEEVMVLMESCLMGAYLTLVKLGGDEKVLDVMVDGVRQRLAEHRLGDIKTEGQS